MLLSDVFLGDQQPVEGVVNRAVEIETFLRRIPGDQIAFERGLGSLLAQFSTQQERLGQYNGRFGAVKAAQSAGPGQILQLDGDLRIGRQSGLQRAGFGGADFQQRRF